MYVINQNINSNEDRRYLVTSVYRIKLKVNGYTFKEGNCVKSDITPFWRPWERFFNVFIFRLDPLLEVA